MREEGATCPILIDTGTSDQFYDLLGSAAFASAVAEQKGGGKCSSAGWI
jgi:hypothetical protein